MLKLKVRSLNCSAGGVLYHYVSSFDELVDSIKNGLYVSKPEGQRDKQFNVPFISFSRTRINPMVIGPSRWNYGLVLSKDKLSNLGKIKPYSHGGQMMEHSLISIRFIYNLPIAGLYERSLENNIIYFECDFYYDESDDDEVMMECKVINVLSELGDYASVPLKASDAKIVVDWLKKNKDKVKSYINDDSYWFRLAGKYKDIQDMLKNVPDVVADLVKQVMAEVKPVDTEPDTTLTIFTRQKLRDEKNPTRKTQVSVSKADCEELIKFIEMLDSKPDSESTIEISQEGRNRDVEITIDPADIESQRDLPDIIRKIRQMESLPEHEDRLLLPGVEPGTTYSKTVPAIIGVMVPDTEWNKKPVKELRTAHPELKFYSYTAPNTKSKRTDRDSRRNPVD